MRAENDPLQRDELVEDADDMLRSLSRKYPEALASMVLRPDERLEGASWLETQVSMRPLRMDRVLDVRLEGGSSRLLHSEWTDRLTQDVQRRMGEYHLAVASGEHIDAEAANKMGKRGRKKRPIESSVVVLRGRKKKWPEKGTYRTTPEDTEFGGVWFHIEPVYQRTVAELEARGSPFWLVFVPLARDVDEEKLRSIIKRLRKTVVTDDFDELVATMLSLAKMKKDSKTLMDVIRSASEKERPMHPFLRDGLERGMEKGIQKGLQKGLQKAFKKAYKKEFKRGFKKEFSAVWRRL